MKNFLCFAHRGASGHEPENTLPAFEKAIALGAEWIELDVHAVEGELIVIHDDRLERTTNGTGYVTEKSLDDLRSLDAGNGQRIPTLREVFDLVDQRAGINVELKGPDTAGLTCQLINEYVNDHGWISDRFIVSSFNRHELKKAHRLMPGIKIGVILGGAYCRYAAFAKRRAVYSVHPRMDLVNIKFVEQAHRLGLKVFVYTVNNIADIMQMKAMGVDGIFTNYPEHIGTC